MSWETPPREFSKSMIEFQFHYGADEKGQLGADIDFVEGKDWRKVKRTIEEAEAGDPAHSDIIMIERREREGDNEFEGGDQEYWALYVHPDYDEKKEEWK